MDGETIFQVKVKRSDVYAAVRNLLLNEFKILPHDLLAAVDKKIAAKIEDAAGKQLDSWGFRRRMEDALEQVIRNAKNTVDRLIQEEIKRLIQEEIKKRVQEFVTKELVIKMLKGV